MMYAKEHRAHLANNMKSKWTTFPPLSDTVNMFNMSFVPSPLRLQELYRSRGVIKEYMDEVFTQFEM
jgi:hypothetical protein